jgi:hypothetical protein
VAVTITISEASRLWRAAAAVLQGESNRGWFVPDDAQAVADDLFDLLGCEREPNIEACLITIFSAPGRIPGGRLDDFVMRDIRDYD